ncbi:MAG: hypothetical protein H6821_06650 [Planctomycetaceae bacterium]|nr:hypothetical protein [Planctomycetales bacterium]MCB9873843.1 hypothetical protein [Planctomycetaceae bacterium]MCB9941451.1 hypothetical protein [Planctomycetaceae bacterium]
MKGMVGVAQSISTKMVFSVFIEVSIGQTITVAKLFWDRLPACQFSHDRLEAYPTYCLGGAKADTLRAVGWSDWLVPANPNKPSDARETSALSVLKPRFTPRFPLILVVEVNRSAEEFVG